MRAILWEPMIFKAIQKKVQARFRKSYEVIVCKSDFVMASHVVGHANCMWRHKGFTISVSVYFVVIEVYVSKYRTLSFPCFTLLFPQAYATPRQYDHEYQTGEDYYFSIAEKEPLGSTEITLPFTRPFHVPLKLEGEGPRRGFPVGSHCEHYRTG